jgi:hypothetical protein
MNEFTIIKHIRRFFATAEYALQNVFIWDWESDYFCITTSGYTIEVEIKISKSDFKADSKKKQKHFILQNSLKEVVTMPGETFGNLSQVYFIKPKTPNKFYYCCPEGMIEVDEVPEYAGLLYYRQVPDNKNEHTYDSIIQVKPAKFLHKNKPDISKLLLNKYYYLYLDLRAEYSNLKRLCDNLQQKYCEYPENHANFKHLDEPKLYEPSLFDFKT